MWESALFPTARQNFLAVLVRRGSSVPAENAPRLLAARLTHKEAAAPTSLVIQVSVFKLLVATKRRRGIAKIAYGALKAAVSNTFAVMHFRTHPARWELSAKMAAVLRPLAVQFTQVVHAAPVRFALAVCASINRAQQLTQAASARQVTLVWQVLVSQGHARPRRRPVLVAEMMRDESAWKVCAAITYAVSISQQARVMVGKFAMRLLEHQAVSFQLAAVSTLAAHAPKRMKSV